jgi:hypothetical protein
MMPLGHYVMLGRSGLRVSPFCLGTMTFGEDWGWGSSVEDSGRILDRYVDLGGNFIDTANVYTKGHSEKILGDHLRGSRAKRQRVVIATKFFGTMLNGDPNSRGAGRKALIAACDESLRRCHGKDRARGRLDSSARCAVLGAESSRRDLDDHRRAHDPTTRGQPRCPGIETRACRVQVAG